MLSEATEKCEVKVRVWTKQSIQELLEVSDKAVERAILAIYARQTEGEKYEGSTVVHNSMGFGAYDANVFTRMAKEILAGKAYTHANAEFARRWKIKRYWRQLVEIANENEKEKLCSPRK